MRRRQPKVTVIIPALNEADVIGECLTALERQDYPREFFEIIVADNGSTDGTVEIAREYRATVLNEPRRSAYFARNTAIVRSTGDYLAFTDADCSPDSKWLISFVDASHEKSELIASGLTIYDIKVNNIGNKLLSEAHTPETLKNYVTEFNCVAGNNMFVSRSVFEKYGLFRVAQSGADTDFSQRAERHDLKPFFVEGAVVRHQCDLTNLEYLNRTYGEQRGQALLHSSPPSLVRLLAAIGRLPWRPGLSHLKAGTAEWSYRWLDRWCGYAGRIRGEYLAWRGMSFPIPTYSAYK